MFKVFVWSAAISATGAAALFVPIDPALLGGAGISQGEPAGIARPAARILAAAKERRGEGDLNALFNSGETWTVT